MKRLGFYILYRVLEKTFFKEPLFYPKSWSNMKSLYESIFCGYVSIACNKENCIDHHYISNILLSIMSYRNYFSEISVIFE